MSRRSKAARRAAQPSARKVTVVSEPAPGPTKFKSNSASWWNIYEAAERRDFSGYFYIPTLDLSQVLNTVTRDALRERVTWLYLNVPPVRMVIDGLAHEEAATGLWPKWTTSNPNFNKFATDTFHWTNHDPRYFSSNARDSFYGSQVHQRKLIRLHGDCFGQFIRPNPGSMKPLFSLIPGWRVDNIGSTDEADGWYQGIKGDRAGRAQFYRVLPRVPGIGKTPEDFMDVPADDMLHLYDGLLGEQVRGEPALTSVAKRLFKREDILAALTNGTLARERMGWALESQTNGMPMAMPDSGEVTTETAADGSKLTVQKIFGSGARDDIAIPEIPAGMKLNTVESARPAAQVREFLDEILREAAWSTGYPPDYLFFLAGLTQGTAVRLVMQRVQTMLNAARQQLALFVHRWAVFDTWQRIKAGVFDGVQGGIPDDWWKHKIMEPAPITVDLGREGALYSDRVASGQMSIERFHALAEEDPADVEDELFERIKVRLEKLAVLNKAMKTDLKYSDLFRTADSKWQSADTTTEPGSPPAH